MSPGAIVLCALYALSGAVVFVLMLRAICNQPPPAEGVDGRQQRFPVVVGAPPPATTSGAPPALIVAPAEPVPPPPVALPYFPYAWRGGRSGGQGSETVVCAICLDPLRRGQPCSEVPACRHTFHRDCVGAWARSSNSCPLCRVKIVARYAAPQDDMV